MDNGITQELFDQVHSAVDIICKRALSEPKLVLTEGDLQSWIFSELVKDATLSHKGLHIHCHFNYLKNETKLGNIPDIVIIPLNAYDIDSNGNLYNQKGYTVWGDSIALELKLIRSHRKDGIASAVRKDLDKLKSIRERHYTKSRVHSFFAASVILCRRRLPDEYILGLRSAAEEREIPIWIYNMPNG
jgi:hypothetical protein